MNLADPIFTVADPDEVAASANTIASMDSFKKFERSSRSV
jgi:hypothetical protein